MTPTAIPKTVHIKTSGSTFFESLTHTYFHRIRHCVILDDPFDDPPGLEIPDQSPPPARDANRLEDDETVDENAGKTQEEIEEELKAKEARSRAVVLEMV